MLTEKKTELYIKNYLSQNKHPALILLGDKGIGKRLMADEIARKLLNTDSLNTCPDYLSVESMNGSILLDQLSEIKNRISYCAITADYKVIVIDDADTMNAYAQNSLLKILEDGNATNIFIFVAHKPLLDTIHSRCETISVKNPSNEEVLDFFKNKGQKIDEIIMKIADNRLGVYQQMLNDDKFTDDSKQIIHQFITMKKKRDLFDAFGLVKEKDSNCFYENHSYENVKLFLEYIKELFKDVLYDFAGISNGTDYTTLKNNYDMIKCLNIITVLDQHLSNMNIKGKYTKNDFFDLVRFIVS